MPGEYGAESGGELVQTPIDSVGLMHSSFEPRCRRPKTFEITRQRLDELDQVGVGLESLMLSSYAQLASLRGIPILSLVLTGVLKNCT